MILYTSYYAMGCSLVAAGISIQTVSRTIPEWFPVSTLGATSIDLEPPHILLKAFKQGEVTKEQFTDFYMEELRYRYKTPQALYDTLCTRWLNTKKLALLCWEKPGTFCHRSLIAEYLISGGYLVSEYGIAEGFKNF